VSLRVRLDQLLVDRGLAPSRAAAQAMLMAGEVELPGAPSRVLKPGQLVAADRELNVLPRPRWASRGGEKLEAALDAFAIDPSGWACLDAGASTGGFTDVLLARGARVVYAVDVGRAQLLDRLRKDPRVRAMERTNLRTLQTLQEAVELATLDLSFISLRLVLPAVRRLLKADGQVVALVKPQFEAGRGAVPRGGVVRDPGVHRDVLLRFGEEARAAGFGTRAVIRSPIAGGDGNLEFLAHLTALPGATRTAWARRVRSITAASVQPGRITMRDG
jgi:23S rRNA (cytidine1920-2'-O)/16S rRNA (cytidine1409-2'-O)-methyltransferase